MSKDQNIASMLRMFQSQFLDSYNCGIRKFATLSDIRRSRLKQLFTGNYPPSEIELQKITIAMNIIVEQHKLNMDNAKRLATEPDIFSESNPHEGLITTMSDSDISSVLPENMTVTEVVEHIKSVVDELETKEETFISEDKQLDVFSPYIKSYL